MSLDQLLKSMVKENVSDIHFKVGSPPKVRLNGQLIPVKYNNLTPEDTRSFALNLMSEEHKELFNKRYELDFSYSLPGVSRFRVNVFKQRDVFTIIMRIVPDRIPTIEELRLPETVKKIALENRGMVLVTGVTGSGKSTTLASMINLINHKRKAHILTIEDPIEFLYEDELSSISQREIGSDTNSFADALRSAFREDPDVILVGEMRDAETVSTVIKAAETGHLVFSTLHTTDAKGTITRIIDSFPPYQQQQIRYQLSENIKGVISQRLLPLKDDTGRIVATEVMVSTPTIRSCIEEPEKTLQIKDVIEAGKSQYGSQSFDQHLTELYKNGLITLEVAVVNATNPSDFQRALQFE